LHCEEAGVFISGDMVLPTITTNISVQAVSPKDDPLARYLASLDRFRSIPDETLVLPSHGRPFPGLHKRLDTLGNHHADRLRVVEAACREARSAADILGDLFDRPLDGHQIIFAMGEAIAHLNHLEHQGRLRSRLGSDGILRFQALRQDSTRPVKMPIHS
jgi:glyoxylase-like metal-dependent hydrolase (beta-lactamase superfamily II)